MVHRTVGRNYVAFSNSTNRWCDLIQCYMKTIFRRVTLVWDRLTDPYSWDRSGRVKTPCKYHTYMCKSHTLCSNITLIKNTIFVTYKRKSNTFFIISNVDKCLLFLRANIILLRTNVILLNRNVKVLYFPLKVLHLP